MYEFLFFWLLIGNISTTLAIIIFRRNKPTNSMELALTSLGTLAGPITTIMLLKDLLFNRTKIE